MNTPDITRMVETFIRIDVRADLVATWQRYLNLLRLVVAPLIRELMRDRLIDWYSFLVHGRQSGVPTTEEDDGVYIHLGMALAPGIDVASLLDRLPASCVMTRPMPMPNRASLDTIDIQSLTGAKVEWGWRVLGESSEWVLNDAGVARPGATSSCAECRSILALSRQSVAGEVRGNPNAMKLRSLDGKREPP